MSHVPARLFEVQQDLIVALGVDLVGVREVEGQFALGLEVGAAIGTDGFHLLFTSTKTFGIESSSILLITAFTAPFQ